MTDEICSADNEYTETEVLIKHQPDRLVLERVLQQLKNDRAISEKILHEMELVAGELSENILKHGGEGKISVLFHPHPQSFLELISENVGTLPENAQVDGMSTAHTLGIGLGIVARLSDVLSYEQIGAILRIRAVKYCGTFPARSEVAVLTYPVLMRENTNGDSFVIRKHEDDFFCVIDALGHGEEAYVSACEVSKFILANATRPTNVIIDETHAFIKAKRVRGVAMSMVRVDYARKIISYSGLGDVMAKIFSTHEDKTWYPMPKEGIVGDIHRTVDIQEFPLVHNAWIAIYSDGLSNKLTIPLERRTEKPAQLVNDLMNLYGKKHDDRTLLLAKII